jgi:hypothetical protein
MDQDNTPEREREREREPKLIRISDDGDITFKAFS